MRSLAGCVAIAVMLVGGPLAAQDAAEPPATIAASPQALDTPPKEAAVPARGGSADAAFDEERRRGRQRCRYRATCIVELAPSLRPRRRSRSC